MSALPGPLRADPAPGLLASALYALYDALWILLIALCSPWWLARLALDPKFRAMAAERLGAGLPPPRAPGGRARLLVHGVSVGEVKAAQALVRELARERPDLELVVSTVTTTGRDVARRLYPDARVVRLPFDVSFLVRRFLRRVSPECAVLVELEVWPSFLREANRLGVPIAVVNGRITPKSYRRYTRFKRLLPQFERISLYCAQAEEYAARFRALGADPARVVVTGNVKADGLRTEPREPPAELARFVAVSGAAPHAGAGAGATHVIVAGSTHANEEAQLVRAWRRAFAEARLVLVPRHPVRAAGLVRELAQLGPEPQLLTRLRAGEPPDARRPLLVDTIGELEAFYGLADLVYVGGSLVEHGGQNVLEPAAQGRPVVHGPHVANFVQEVALLEQAGAARAVRDEAELGAACAELLADPARRAAMGRAARAAVEGQKGATRLTLAALSERILDRRESAEGMSAERAPA